MPHQRDLMIHAGLHLVAYDAIAIKFIPFESPQQIDFAVVSSKNAVLSILQKGIQVGSFYCVGEKTQALLKENGQNVVKMAENGQKLGEIVPKIHKNAPIYFFCGNQRMDDIPLALEAANIPFKEIVCYETTANHKSFSKSFDAVLFFSPSGVKSYTENNSLDGSWAICIGETTAAAAKPFSKKIAVANATTVESVIAKTVKTLQIHD